MTANRSLAVWRLEVLGGLRAISGAVVLNQFGSRKIASLLVRLAITPQRAHSREELIDLLWPDADLATGRNRLRHALSTLKRLLQPPGVGDVLLADRTGVRINADALRCDALEFEQSVRAGRLADAMQLYRGELLPGFYDDWVQEERSRLQAIFDRLNEAGAARARPAALPGTGPAQLPVAPTIGVTLFPDRQLLLPSYLSSFFGRQGECAELAALVRSHRLVTLSGAGGCGKTRLAVEVGRSLADHFETMLFVALADAQRPDTICEAVRQLLRLPATGQEAEAQVVDFLCEREALLVLDNFEQLVAAGAADVVERLLGALPRLHCLVTSRRVLMVEGEREFPLLPLPLPDAEATTVDLAASAAVALFVDRARGSRPEFQVTARNAPEIGALARALEGVPLAIELAASRIRAMSVTEMAREIERRRDWLARSGPPAKRNPRHASLQAAFEWSWRLLSEEQRRFVCDLTVFRGGWTAEAATATCAVADARPMLDALVADSWLQTQTDASGSTRFSMLEMIRQFVLTQEGAGDIAATRARHRAYFVEAVQRKARRDATRLALDLPNVEQALACGIDEGDHATARQLAVALRPYAEARGLGPRLIDLVAALAAAAPDQNPESCRMHMMLAEALTVSCRMEEAVRHAARAVQLAPSGLLRAEADFVRARVAWDSLVSAIAHKPALEGALAAARAEGAAHLQARILNLLGNIALKDERDPEAAEGHYRQSADLAQRHGLERLAAQGRFNLGIVSRRRRRFDIAVRCSDEVIRDCRRRGDSTLLADALHERGLLLAEMRCWKESVGALRECAEHCWQHRTIITLLYALWNLARPLARVGEAERAARLVGCAAACWERQGGPLSSQDLRYVRRVHGLAAAFIGRARAESAYREGAALGVASGVELALGRR